MPSEKSVIKNLILIKKIRKKFISFNSFNKLVLKLVYTLNLEKYIKKYISLFFVETESLHAPNLNIFILKEY
jgi:hypothetical protein